jgi:hypothetical protein
MKKRKGLFFWKLSFKLINIDFDPNIFFVATKVFWIVIKKIFSLNYICCYVSKFSNCFQAGLAPLHHNIINHFITKNRSGQLKENQH